MKSQLYVLVTSDSLLICFCLFRDSGSAYLILRWHISNKNPLSDSNTFLNWISVQELGRLLSSYRWLLCWCTICFSLLHILHAVNLSYMRLLFYVYMLRCICWPGIHEDTNWTRATWIHFCAFHWPNCWNIDRILHQDTSAYIAVRSDSLFRRHRFAHWNLFQSCPK